MKPAAMGVGRKDLADGLDFLVTVGTAEKLPLVSSNILLAGGKRPFPAFKYIDWAGKKAAVFSLTYAMPERDKEMGITVTDWTEAAKDTLDQVKGADFVILLTDIGFDAEHELARKVRGINLIIGGGPGQRLLSDPDRVENTLLVRSADRGRHLGVLDLQAESISKDWKLPIGQSQTRAMRAQLDSLSASIDKESQNKDAASKEEVAKLKKAREEINRALENVTAGTAAYKHNISVLDSTVLDDPATAKAIEALGQNPAEKRREEAARAAKSLTRSEGDAGKTKAPSLAKPKTASAADAAPAAGPYNTGTVPCRKCHQKEYSSWIRTPHYRSGTSIAREKSGRTECYDCHYSRLTFVTGIAIEQLVGCEVCHGRGSLHEGKAGIKRKPEEGLCRTCHSGFHEKKDFDFQRAYEAIRCDRK
jgi:2',3'-cyclic-nucleotide 2'-phosphodiesterase (5'-nucleotidase family)